MDDRDIAARCGRGDRAAWDEFLGRYSRFVAFAARKFAGEAHADEVIQNTYLALLKDGGALWSRYNPAYRLTTFIGLVVRSQADRFRRIQLPLVGLAAEFAAADDPPAGPAADVERAINALSPRERLMVRMYYQDGLAYREIAQALKVPVNTVASHLLRARMKLKDRLGGGRPPS